jgi:hypothetical protein
MDGYSERRRRLSDQNRRDDKSAVKLSRGRHA